MGKAQNLPTISPKLERIAELAKADSELQFTSIAHLLKVELLREAFRLLRKDAASGVSGETTYEYADNLEENLEDLHDRLRNQRYKAPPVKRVWIDKGKGKKRPLGIPEVEDKIVQKAATILLTPIYENDFLQILTRIQNWTQSASCHERGTPTDLCKEGKLDN